ncbi:MAG: hypothetical protein PHV05_10755 [Candidatus Riflebacteria bacterium]|nr:hypothetical protein [Candidatus Riflebacteria bacterium]
MNETAKEIFYLLSFSVSTGFLLSKTLYALYQEWQDNNWLKKNRNHRYRP